MRTLHLIAGAVLAFEMPVPIYWLILHGRINFWRRHVRAGYWTAVLVAWGAGGLLLYHFRAQLFTYAPRSMAAIVAGVALIAVEFYTFAKVEGQLGSRRLVGHAELTHSGDLATSGLYAHVRHPRYLGMMSAVVGACLLAGTRMLWLLAAIWFLVAWESIRLEERELRIRFDPAYSGYAQRVPAVLPIRFGHRHG